MNKITVCMLAAAALSISTSAYAAEIYDGDTNSVSGVDGSDYRTVLIMKENSDEISYVGQSENGATFSAAAKFLLKDDPENGLYTVLLGGNGTGKAEKKRFYIGMPITATDIKCDSGNIFTEDGAIAYGWENADASNGLNSIVVKMNGSVYAYDFPVQYTGEGAVSLGVRITGINEVITDAEAYLSSTIISDITGE